MQIHKYFKKIFPLKDNPLCEKGHWKKKWKKYHKLLSWPEEIQGFTQLSLHPWLSPPETPSGPGSSTQPHVPQLASFLSMITPGAQDVSVLILSGGEAPGGQRSARLCSLLLCPQHPDGNWTKRALRLNRKNDDYFSMIMFSILYIWYH